jgi:N-acetylglucosaminyl-diphospho-decaprenol L-rhamnosyltransferase
LKKTIRVDIILVNWNSGKLSCEALSPYLNYQSEFLECVIHVVDNASTDDSQSVLADSSYNLITNPKNLGFGKACNKAYPFCSGEYILLLNPDTRSTTDVLGHLVAFLENNASYAVAGPQQIDDNQNVSRTCGRFPSFLSAFFEVTGLSKLAPSVFLSAPIMKDWNHKGSRDVDHVMGSYMLIRKSAVEKTGFMDEDYFVYMEDLDLSKRLHDAGYKTYYDASCKVFHAGGGTGAKASSKRLAYSITSRRIYWKKHLGLVSYFMLTILSLTIEPILRIAQSITNKNKPRILAILKVYGNYALGRSVKN